MTKPAARDRAQLVVPAYETGPVRAGEGRPLPGCSRRSSRRPGLVRSRAIPARRADEVLGAVGLEAVADRRAKGLSPGMAQRLGIAAALIGDPGVLILDEPVNGLDAEGVRWVRTLPKSPAAEGRTVFLSSHLVSGPELTADRIIVIGRGRLLADTDMRGLIEANPPGSTPLRTPDDEPGRMRVLPESRGAAVRPDARGGWRVTGPTATAVGEPAREHGLAVHELLPAAPPWKRSARP
ncbi:ATP-binding cassette domain-containing protein [Streptomyces sp. enrichment culture]|uniref:ATP-binding cassette domain-containing protein n=1 Tax=Streptomyces sp. enrichment culture TaxID=1795815 RepID=UPI003F57F7FA